jgi:hypothetical protein
MSVAPLRIAVVDRDSGFVRVLNKRMDQVGWEHRVLSGPVPAEAVKSMRLSALVVDVAVLAPHRRSPNGFAAYGWEPMTGSPSHATPRK